MKLMTGASRQDLDLETSQKKLILYVEDEPNNRLVLDYRIGKKYNLLYASTDLEACRILSMRGQELFVVLMDIELKDSALNGIELTRLMRGLLDRSLVPEHARSVPLLQIPVFLVTSYGSRYEDELAECGADGVIAKPVEFAALEESLMNCALKK